MEARGKWQHNVPEPSSSCISNLIWIFPHQTSRLETDSTLFVVTYGGANNLLSLHILQTVFLVSLWSWEYFRGSFRTTKWFILLFSMEELTLGHTFIIQLSPHYTQLKFYLGKFFTSPNRSIGPGILMEIPSVSQSVSTSVHQSITTPPTEIVAHMTNILTILNGGLYDKN